MRKLIINIKQLLQIRDMTHELIKGSEMNILPTISDAFVLIDNDKIGDFGKMSDLTDFKVDNILDAEGKIVLPSWCDSHTHLVYAGNRENEFVDRIKGLTYEEIASKGGGILNSSSKLQNTREEDLFTQSEKRLKEVMLLGTGAIEIKSGYGLSCEAELKMLRVIKKLTDTFPIAIKSTFLGAHAFPKKYLNNKDGYVDLIIDEMLPAVIKENLAEFVDVFCEVGYFDIKQTDRILKAAINFGLKPKIHVNQFTNLGGVQLGVRHNALTVDHLEVLDKNDLLALKGSQTIPVALPTCSYFLGIPYTPARQIIDAGLPLGLASDFNPGSSPSGNMNFVVSTACIKMKMTPNEAINAATLNGAYAMNLSKTHGSITKGKVANLIITKPIPSYNYLPYAFGSNLIDTIILNGSVYNNE
jgi:imidazolonepropionase